MTTTSKYQVHWLTVGESKIPIAVDDIEHRVLIRLFAQGMGLVTAKQRSLIREHSEIWETRGIKVQGESALRYEPSLPVRWFDAYLWSVNAPLNQGAKRRLADVQRGWREAFLDEFAPETLDSPSALRIAAAVAQAVAAKDLVIAELRSEVSRLETQLDGKQGFFGANATHRIARGATRSLGPEDFTQIRDPQTAGISDEEMARRFLASAGSIRQIRDGRYPSLAFRAWMKTGGVEMKSLFDDNQREAKRAWGEKISDWVLALALACDEVSQRKIAERLGVSPAVVNQVLKLKYKGRYDRVEARVREELLEK